MYCDRCKEGDVCFGEVAIVATDLWLETQNNKKPNNKIRNRCYKEATSLIHGFLGAGNRERLPTCVVDSIRQAYPDDNASYMGYKKY